MYTPILRNFSRPMRQAQICRRRDIYCYLAINNAHENISDLPSPILKVGDHNYYFMSRTPFIYFLFSALTPRLMLFT